MNEFPEMLSRPPGWTATLPLIVVPTPEHVTPDGTVMLALIVCPEMLPVQDWVAPNASLEMITPPLTTMNAEQITARTRVLIRPPLSGVSLSLPPISWTRNPRFA